MQTLSPLARRRDYRSSRKSHVTGHHRDGWPGSVQQRDGPRASARHDPDAIRLATVVKPLPIVSVDAPIVAPAGVEAYRRVDRWLSVEEQSTRVWGGHLADVDICEGDPRQRLLAWREKRTPR